MSYPAVQQHGTAAIPGIYYDVVYRGLDYRT